MGKERTIKKQTGYPTSDGELHATYSEAVKHQTGIDINKACQDDVDIESESLIAFLKKNLDIVNDYIKHNLTEKKTAKPKAEENAEDKKSSPKKKAAANSSGN